MFRIEKLFKFLKSKKMGCIPSKNNLESCTLENTKKVSFSGQAKVIDIHDGDTCTLAVPFRDGYGLLTCRLFGIDCAEISKASEEEIKVGLAGKKYLQERILGKIVYLECSDQRDIRGRDVLGTIYLGKSVVNQELIDKKYAYRYYGGKKRAFEDWYMGMEEVKTWSCCGLEARIDQRCSSCQGWSCSCGIKHRRDTKMCSKCRFPPPE